MIHLYCQPQFPVTADQGRDTSGSKARRRFYRTVLLGVAAMGVLVWTAVEQFGISIEEMTALFLGAVLITVGIAACAAFFTFLWIALRGLVQRRGNDD